MPIKHLHRVMENSITLRKSESFRGRKFGPGKGSSEEFSSTLTRAVTAHKTQVIYANFQSIVLFDSLLIFVCYLL